MSRADQIYPLRKRLEKELSLASSDPNNAEILTRYYKVRSGEVSPATVVADMVRLNILSRTFNKKFEGATLQDIEDLVFKIDQRKNKPKTLNKFRQALKQFYRWMRGYPKGQYPPEVMWIAMKKVPFISVTAEDLISFDEAVKITEFAQNLRDKALFQCKIDAGCRIGEILTPKIGEVRFNEAGAVVSSDGKTGHQPIILTWSARTLAQWLNIHPFRNDKDAPVFCLLEREKPGQLSYAAAARAFKKCVKRAGYNKRVWLHLLKHVSCTEDSIRGMPDSYRRYKHHWSPNSKMLAIYEHLSQSIIPKIQNETWKVLTGQSKVAEQEQEKPIQLLKACRRCQYENPRDSKFCNRCGLALDESKGAEVVMLREKIDAFMNKLTEDPEKLQKLLSLID